MLSSGSSPTPSEAWQQGKSASGLVPFADLTFSAFFVQGEIPLLRA
jgi:hypothetical protein